MVPVEPPPRSRPAAPPPRARRASDQVLVRAAQDGDVDAFGELVGRHQAAMFRLALRMLGSHADAQDVVQDAFVKAWRSLGRFRGQSAFSTWMYRITTNGCLDAIAARRPTAELPEERTSGGDDVARTAERHERVALLLAAIGQLPGDQRAALVLRDVQGLSYQEVADVLEIQLSTAKTRVHRARRRVVDLVVDLVGPEEDAA